VPTKKLFNDATEVLRKTRLNQSKINRRKEKIKIRAEINEMETTNNNTKDQ
jgi:hypothetical protein